MTTRILTGITTTGTPHLGNYAGAIRPAIVASRAADADSFYFLADYHALIKCDDPARIQRSRLEIAATWLALGLDTDKATFYRQSDIPEIPELCWLLTCVAGKGLLNRAHAYKASVDKNLIEGEDPDAGITMGLFSYPVLMAADILMFNAHKVPVGRDQIQHVEMARDIAQRFNHLFGQGRELFTLPEAVIEADVATLPGLDGRKMSKSYDNTIPLFSSEKELKKVISLIVTDSKAPGEPKDPDNSHLFTLYQAFATPAQLSEFRAELINGLAWGEAKNRLFQLLNNELGEARERYQALISKPADLEDILLVGAEKARNIARPFLGELREAVGLRSFKPKPVQQQLTLQDVGRGVARLLGKAQEFAEGMAEGIAEIEAAKKKAKKSRFVSFRDDDGSFRFRLLDAAGEQLLLSKSFADGKAAGMVNKRLQSGEALDIREQDGGFCVWLDGECVAQSPAFADSAACEAAIARLREALAPQE
ncbi:tryptophan--tRNA ligase [Pseudomonas sp.]|uniref:tryptophan--tRNA ligase n=1 Tax=Pseudomonas sp. TaxID=306 RepID=UPI0027349433|nr:tryptophan--tRNA ligase [Pseudomonas sp.]MDP2747042.1 tryptophan--tRNA ligase [Pseudomonas sp.]